MIYKDNIRIQMAMHKVSAPRETKSLLFLFPNNINDTNPKSLWREEVDKTNCLSADCELIKGLFFSHFSPVEK